MFEFEHHIDIMHALRRNKTDINVAVQLQIILSIFMQLYEMKKKDTA